MLLAAVLPAWLVALTAWSVALVTLGAGVRLLTGWTPVRWVWGRLVAQPAREGLREALQEEVTPMLDQALKQLLKNSGSSFRDAVDTLVQDFTDFKEYQHGRNHDLMNALVIIKGNAQLEELRAEQSRLNIARAQADEAKRARTEAAEVKKDLGAAATVVKDDLDAANIDVAALTVLVAEAVQKALETATSQAKQAATVVKDDLDAAAVIVKADLDKFNEENA